MLNNRRFHHKALEYRKFKCPVSLEGHVPSNNVASSLLLAYPSTRLPCVVAPSIRLCHKPFINRPERRLAETQQVIFRK